MFPSMDFASAFFDEEDGEETRISGAIPPEKNDTHDYESSESLMLDSSIHTFGLNYDSVEHQLSLLERDSDDLFESLLAPKRKQNSSLQESSAFLSADLLRRDSISFNFDEDLGYNDIDNLFKSDDTIVPTGTPTAEAMHAFNQEYESRLNVLRQCMFRTKSSRSRVAKVKQVMKQRYLKDKYSYRNKLVRSVGVNTRNTDYSRQKLLQSQMYLNQISYTSSLRSTDELSRHSSRSNSPNSHAITLE